MKRDSERKGVESMAHPVGERQEPLEGGLTDHRRRATRRALRFTLVPVFLMAVVAIVTFEGDWTYLVLAGAMVLVVLGMMYLDHLRADRPLPPGSQGLVTQFLERRGASLPEPAAAQDAMARVVQIQDEMDALERRDPGEIDGVSPQVAVWAGGLGAALWVVAAVTALLVGELRGALICLVTATFFGGLTWFTQGERKSRKPNAAKRGWGASR